MSSINSQPQQNELRQRLDRFLKELPVSIENIKGNSERICIFIYFLTIREGEGIALKSSLKGLFGLADIVTPSNLDRDLRAMKKAESIIPEHEGYRLHRKELALIEEQLKIGEKNVVLRKNLTDLVTKIKDSTERGLIEESIRCFGTRPSSRRATIILSWMAGIYHLQNYVWKKKKHLKSFNKVLPINSAKGAIIKINKIEDFNEMKEVLLILKLKEAGIIDKNIHKQLKSQLDIRDTCSHPNAIIFSDSKTEAFVEDMIQNILIHYKV